MKKCGSTTTATASKPMNEPAEIIINSSIDSTTSDVQRNGNPICQPFSMRGYVAEMRNTTPKACIPFDGISENTWEQVRGSLDAPRFRWWRCKNCVRKVVPSSTAAEERLNAEQMTSLQLCIPETEKDSCLELIAAGGSLEGNANKSPVEAINMVDSDGEREIPYTCDLQLLATVALAEMASDLPPLQETCQRLNAKKDSSFERRTAGFVTEVIVQEGDKALIDLVDSDDEREQNIIVEVQDSIAGDTDKAPVEVIILDDSEDEGVIEITGSQDQELTWVDGMASSGKSATEKRPCLDKGKNIITEIQGQEFVRPQGSGKAKRSCPFSPKTDPISRKHAKATGSFAQPLLPQSRRKSNGGK